MRNIKLIAAYCFIFCVSQAWSAAEKPKVLVATFSGIISPVSAEYMSQAIAKAQEGGKTALVIRLDTPGGLDTAMRTTIKDILASKVPVILYVSPPGARAASAGVFIAMASHVAAMAPSTNIGAAHPVMIGATGSGKEEKDKKTGSTPMEDKILNDASAYMKSITQERGRNVDWAIKAVTHSDSISAEEAVKLKVVDFIAVDLNELLQKADGLDISKFGKLRTKDAELEYFEPSSRQKLLAAISDPNIAMILMSLGAAGLFIELYNPGLILPGVVGATSLIMAFYAFNTLSANFAGVALILLGLIFFIAEVKVVSYGLLTTGGVLSMLLGGLMLFKSQSSMGVSLSNEILFTTVAGLVAITAAITWLAARAFTRKVVTGVESMAGKSGIAKTDLQPSGTVLVEGELWDAQSLSGPVKAGQGVVVESIKGFKVFVRSQPADSLGKD